MKQTLFLLLTAFFLMPSSLSAQVSKKDSTLITKYLDSLSVILNKYDTEKPENKQDPYLYQMTSPTYYNAPLRSALGLDSVSDARQKAMYDALLNAYLNNPTAFTGTEDSLNAVKNVTGGKVADAPEIKVEDLVEVGTPVAQTDLIEIQVAKPKFWKHNANIYFQFSQSFISGNWYNGGESSNTMLGGFTLEANFDDQKKVVWDNKAEIKVGFITARGDTLHRYKTNNDLFRLTSKFGYKAIKNWYYTLLMELNNQFFPGYKTNNPVMFSNFTAPLKYNASIGMDWKLAKEKKYTFSLAVLPFSYNFIWVAGHKVNPTLFGIKDGRRTLHKFGSKLQLDHTLYFTENFSWKSHFYVFTSYKSTDSLWENTVDFAMNKYLSAKMYLNLRFDDSGKKSDNHGYLQIQELLSFGLSYTL